MRRYLYWTAVIALGLLMAAPVAFFVIGGFVASGFAPPQ